MGYDMDIDRLLLNGHVRLRKRFGGFIHIHVMGAPNPIAGLDAGEINSAITKAQFQALANGLNLIEPTALLLNFRAAPISSIKDDAITSFERGDVLNIGRLDENTILRHFCHAT